MKKVKKLKKPRKIICEICNDKGYYESSFGKMSCFCLGSNMERNKAIARMEAYYKQKIKDNYVKKGKVLSAGEIAMALGGMWSESQGGFAEVYTHNKDKSDPDFIKIAQSIVKVGDILKGFPHIATIKKHGVKT